MAEGDALSVTVYELTNAFPSDERFGLTSQLRRASVSIASNIAEGHGRQSKADFVRFLRMALGSTREVETQLILAGHLEFVSVDRLHTLEQEAQELARILQGLIRSQQPRD